MHILVAISLWLLPAVLHPVFAQQQPGNGTLNATAFSSIFWQLSDLAAQKPSGNPYLGGQNFSWCCLRAVENALGVDANGSVFLRNNSLSSIGVASIADLVTAAERSQFPCKSTFELVIPGCEVPRELGLILLRRPLGSATLLQALHVG